MKALLDNRLAPLTHSWGFLEVPFQRAVDKAAQWTKSTFSQVEVVNFELSLVDALCSLAPLITPPRKKLLLSTKSNWVAYFDNGVNGGDPSSFVGYLSEHLECRGLAVTCIPHSVSTQDDKGSYGAVIFELYAPEKREWLNVERSITLMNDKGEWTFETNGSVQPFEKTERYNAGNVQDRFTPELLEEYCSALGIRLFDEDFYGPSGVLLKVLDPLPPDFVPVSLAEAREKIGLSKSGEEPPCSDAKPVEFRISTKTSLLANLELPRRTQDNDFTRRPPTPLLVMIRRLNSVFSAVLKHDGLPCPEFETSTAN
jgi:hypothetical protein